VPRGAIEYSGDLLIWPVRTKGEMPGTSLDVLGGCTQPLVHIPAFLQRHLAIEDRSQERMGEPQRVAVALNEASVDGVVDRCPRLLVATSRSDLAFAWV
jgi:hypothetical protein